VPQVRVYSPAAGKKYRVANFKWEEFVQEDGWGNGVTITGPEVAMAMKGVSINFSRMSGENQFFNIYQIGSYGKCNVPPDTVVAKDIDVNYFMDRLYSTATDFLNAQIDYDSIQDSRDGKWYKTVDVYGTTWMAQNMNYETTYSYCYNGLDENCDKYGRLYSWKEAKDACPAGWHLPSSAEWDALWYGYIESAGSVMKSKVGWLNDGNVDGNGVDRFGFAALPAGEWVSSTGGFEELGRYANFWSSTPYDANGAYFVSMFYENKYAEILPDNFGTNGYSVRCIKTEEVTVDSTGCESTDLWCKNTSRDNNYRVNTGVDVGGATSGFWWDTYDNADGGQSIITWPAARGNEYNASVLDSIIDYCKGLCGTYTLTRGTLEEYDPYVMLGFSVAGKPNESSDNVPADVSGWEGICITYTVSVSASLELGLGDTKDAAIGYDNPYTTLPKSETADEVCTTWGKFKQAGWGKGKVTGDEAGAALASVKFKIQAATGTSGSFNISGVRSIKDIEGVIKAKAAASAVKASLSGRTLSFAGIKSVATAEVMNLQGQVMLKGSVSSSASLDLSSIDAGVYMVRVAGKSVDFSQKIILK
jgi:Fibrobacter succinogenes major domain (Fib_succ_major).